MHSTGRRLSSSRQVRLVPRSVPLPCDRAMLETVTQAAFGQRRKMLRQSLRSLGADTPELIAAAELDPTARAEEVSVEQFVRLARMLKVQRGRRGAIEKTGFAGDKTS